MKGLSELSMVGAVGFEPTTSCSQSNPPLFLPHKYQCFRGSCLRGVRLFSHIGKQTRTQTRTQYSMLIWRLQ